MLVGAVFFSLFYDLFWFGLKTAEYSQDLKSDGGMEKSLRKFSLYSSYVSFFFRLFIALVYWKDSLDFENIMHGVQAQQMSQSPVNQRKDTHFIR